MFFELKHRNSELSHKNEKEGLEGINICKRHASFMSIIIKANLLWYDIISTGQINKQPEQRKPVAPHQTCLIMLNILISLCLNHIGFHKKESVRVKCNKF